MPIFNYNAAQYDPNAGRLQKGKYRIRINKAEPCVSRTGKEGYKFEMGISGTKKTLKYWLFLDPENPESTNQRLGRFFDCFGIEDKIIVEDIERTWIGLVGGAMIAENDEGYMGIRYLLGREDQTALPPAAFIDTASAPAPSAVANSATPNFVTISGEDLPF